MLDEHPVTRYGQSAGSHHKRLVIARFKGTKYSLFASCNSSESGTGRDTGASSGPERSYPPVRYFLSKIIPESPERIRSLSQIFELRREQQITLNNGDPLRQDTPFLTVSLEHSNSQLSQIRLECSTAPRSRSLFQMLKDHATLTNSLSVQTKIALMTEALGRARHLFYYTHFVPSLQNLIVDPQHHLTPNLMSTAGLKLLLWGDSISSKEFKEVLPILPTNIFTFPADSRISQPMLKQKAIANIVLSLILDCPLTYSRELPDTVSLSTAQKTLTKIKDFFQVFLSLRPVQKKKKSFVKNAKITQTDSSSQSGKSKLESFLWQTFVDEKAYTYAEIWQSLKPDEDLESSEKVRNRHEVCDLDKQLQRVTQYIWNSWPEEKRNEYVLQQIIRDPQRDHEVLLATTLDANIRVIRSYQSLAGFLVNGPFCKAKEQISHRLLKCLEGIRSSESESLMQLPTLPAQILAEVAGHGEESFKQSQPELVTGIPSAIDGKPEAMQLILPVMGRLLNHRVQEEKAVIMEDKRHKGMREFLKGMHL